jgi:hypothetical protein
MMIFWYDDYWLPISGASLVSGCIGAAIASSRMRSVTAGFFAGCLFVPSALSLLPLHFQAAGHDLRISPTSPGKWALAIALACIGAMYARRREESTLVGFLAGAELGLSAPLLLGAGVSVAGKCLVALTSFMQ